jgi:hypothetical protein
MFDNLRAPAITCGNQLSIPGTGAQQREHRIKPKNIDFFTPARPLLRRLAERLQLSAELHDNVSRTDLDHDAGKLLFSTLLLRERARAPGWPGSFGQRRRA